MPAAIVGRMTAWREIGALFVASASLVAGVVVWLDGTVDIGVEVAVAEYGVVVHNVVPDGNAARYGIDIGQQVLELQTTEGSLVPQTSEPVVDDWGRTTTVPTGEIASERISVIRTGQLFESLEGPRFVQGHSLVARDWLVSRLQMDIYHIVLGVLVGLVVWALLHRGLAGTIGRRHAVVAAAATAVSFLLSPVMQVGNQVGIIGIYVAVVAASLLLGVSLGSAEADAGRRRGTVLVALAASGVAAVLIWQHMATPWLSPNERYPIFAALGLIAVAPAATAGISEARGRRERATLVSLALLPAAALTLLMLDRPEPVVPLVLVAILLGWQILPWAWIGRHVDAGFERVRPGMILPGQGDPAPLRQMRDRFAGGLLLVTATVAIVQDTTWAFVAGLGAAFVVGFALRRGLLGEGWTDAAVPLATAVAFPILLAPLYWMGASDRLLLVVGAGLAVLPVAHLLAGRHPDPYWSARLFAASVATTLIAAVGAIGVTGPALVLVALVPLIPAIPIAAAERADRPAVAWRLESLAVAVTPAFALTTTIPGTGLLVFIAWVVAIVVWRYSTLGPLLGLAQRTQLQRDLAVAAAETERARLAADLHDDALQQLTMLVRTLDDAGQAEAAAEAREVAAKLRAMVGDLRLPILDDLGAGAALEWLVERIEPLAGGAVRLERSDETRPPADVELAVFRVAQEAITNAIRHGKPPIAVRYDVRSDGRVTLAIDDAGPGIGNDEAEEAPRAGHFGLANMQQRAEQIGGLLDVRRWPAGGTRVALEWRPQ